MPGYTGHIKGLQSENLFASSYGNLTARAISQKHSIGHDITPKHKFISQTKHIFTNNNFRRFSK